MDGEEFRRMLDLFPVVRTPDYHIDLDPARQSTSRSAPPRPVEEWHDALEEGDKKEKQNLAIDINDAFWEKLKLAAERKMGAVEADRFCKAFQQVHRKLVCEELSLDAARRFVDSATSAGP